jgi:pyruvate/2-oxoglutarate dehydrogenase complex dihydrolipoamide dehydrogenase (E3) component
MTERAEVIVVGMGPGGEEVAGRLAEAGLDVLGIEAKLLGGECPYWGCVPTKMMIRAANLLAEGRRIPGMAGTATVTADWAPVARRIRDEATDNWNDQVAVDRFVKKGGHFLRGSARLLGPRSVEVDGVVYEASRALVINTGTEPAIPPIDGLADTPYWTNREAIETEKVPESLAILGGGSVGLELAQVFARFGAQVTVVEALDRLLAMEEPEASALAAEALGREGVTIHLGASARNVSHDLDTGFTVALGAGAEPVSAQRLLVATGRRADVGGLGAAALDIPADARFIPVDDHCRVTEGVWALGDVTGKGAYTHVSMYQAAIVIRDILSGGVDGDSGPPADYRALPRVTFTDPEIGAVGLTEAQAREQDVAVRVGLSQVPSSARGWIHKAGNEGFIKIVEDANRGVLVGATSAGPVGGEVLSALVVAVHAEVPVDRLRHMMYAYPTFHRGIEDALRSLDG